VSWSRICMMLEIGALACLIRSDCVGAFGRSS